MNKTVEWLKRGLLVLGVIVALTPCGLCHASALPPVPQVKTCDMGAMDGMKCCHSTKPQSPFCKVMGQSSIAVSSHAANLAVVPVMTTSLVVAFLLEPILSVPAFGRSSASPPRGPLSLRI